MERKHFIATAAGQQRVKFAFNSAIRETEAMVREIGRDEGQNYEGSRPNRVEDVYTRVWTGMRTGRVLEVSVQEKAEMSGTPLFDRQAA
jgi:hypothetical protein